jgi:hypothetical protein
MRTCTYRPTFWETYLYLSPRRCRHYVPPKLWYLCARLHGITTQKTRCCHSEGKNPDSPALTFYFSLLIHTLVGRLVPLFILRIRNYTLWIAVVLYCQMWRQGITYCVACLKVLEWFLPGRTEDELVRSNYGCALSETWTRYLPETGGTLLLFQETRLVFQLVSCRFTDWVYSPLERFGPVSSLKWPSRWCVVWR